MPRARVRYDVQMYNTKMRRGFPKLRGFGHKDDAIACAEELNTPGTPMRFRVVAQTVVWQSKPKKRAKTTT